jgi:hypothetical protein
MMAPQIEIELLPLLVAGHVEENLE